MANVYAEFVKNNIHKFSHLPVRERMKECAKLYHQQRGTVAKPKRVSMKKDVVVQAKGGSIFGDIIPFGHLFGLGLDTKMKPKKATKAKTKAKPKMGKMAHGGNFLEDFADGFTKPFEAIAHVAPLITHLL